LIGKELNSTDLLHKMAVIELIDKIAQSKHGAPNVLQSGTLDSLKATLLDKEDPGFSLLVGSTLQLFSTLARNGYPDVVVGFFDTIREFLNSNDQTCVERAISLIGALGSTVPGISALLSNKPLLKEWFEYMGSTVALYRLSLLHALAELLTCPDHELTLEVYKIEDCGWDGKSSGEVMQSLTKYLDQPFNELRYAVFSVIKSLVLHPWGVKSVFALPTFIGFLVNRNSETTKVGKEWKFAVIQTVVENQATNHADQVLGDDAFSHLSRYLTEGVFYVRAEQATSIASRSG